MLDFREIDPDSLGEKATRLLLTAERLFAERGIHGVSVRELSRAAGLGNHSAVSYYFGSKQQLLYAIMAYRSSAMLADHVSLMEEAREKGLESDLRTLVRVVVTPFFKMLKEPGKDNHYIGFFGALQAQEFNELLRYAMANFEQEISLLIKLIGQNLRYLPPDILANRLTLAGFQASNTFAHWDLLRRAGDSAYSDEQLEWRLEDMISFICAGLSTPC